MTFIWFTPETRPPVAYTRPTSPALAPVSAPGEAPLVDAVGPDGKKNPYFHLDAPQPDRRPVFTVDQIMTVNPVAIDPDTTLLDAWNVMVGRRFRHLPVTIGARPAGIISDRDLMRETSLFGGRLSGDTTATLATVSEIMKRRVLTAAPDTLVRDVARVMFEARIGAMPIVESERLVGMVTRSDILRAVMKNAPLDLWS